MRNHRTSLPFKEREVQASSQRIPTFDLRDVFFALVESRHHDCCIGCPSVVVPFVPNTTDLARQAVQENSNIHAEKILLDNQPINSRGKGRFE
jgi:hypothetical protein